MEKKLKKELEELELSSYKFRITIECSTTEDIKLREAEIENSLDSALGRYCGIDSIEIEKTRDPIKKK